MKKRISSTAWLLILSFILICVSPFCCLAEAGPKHTTVMIYMCGADLESRGKQATQSMGDMIASRYNLDEVNVVILAGGSFYWSGQYDTDKLTLLTIDGRRPIVVDEFEGASMGSADTLSFFLNTCVERYPAEHYDLVLWNHGGGPISGVCFDSLYKSDSLSLQELRQAMDNSPFAQEPLDLLVFHACLMGSTEVAVEMSPYARYMVAGEDSIYGLSYEWLSGLENDPDPLTTARRIVDSAYEYNRKIIQAQHATEINSFAAIDLSKVGEIINHMDVFFPKLSINLSEVSFTTMSNERRGTVCFGIGASGPDSDYDLVDLGDLILHYRSMAESEADALLLALEDAVYCHTDEGNSCMGLTVYHPFINKRAIPDRMSVYTSIDFSKAYIEYIQRFIDLLLATPMTGWNDLETGEPKADKSTYSMYMLQLNEDQAQYLGDADMRVVLANGDDTYRLVFTDPEITYSDGLVRGAYNGSALYAVDRNGERLSDALEYTVDANGNYLISVLLDGRSETGETFTQQALIRCEYDAETRQLKPGEVMVWEDFLSGYTTAYGTTMTDYEAIHIPYVARKLTVNALGEILPFDEWETVDTGETWDIAIDDSWSFALLNDALPRENLFVTFQLTDSQNNRYSSTLYPIDKPGIDTQITYNNDETENNPDINAVTLNEDSFLVKLFEDSLRISGPICYTGNKEIIVNVENLAVNQSAVGDEVIAVIYGTGPNWGMLPTEENPEETQPLSFTVDAALLSRELDQQEITFDLKILDAVTGDALATVPVAVLLKSDNLFDGET